VSAEQEPRVVRDPSYEQVLAIYSDLVKLYILIVEIGAHPMMYVQRTDQEAADET